MRNHTNFILSPITDILKDVVSASGGIGSGIETFPLCDYVMQSVFIKMTGFQEQKMKCICWEMATNDYEFRYEFNKTPLGECSNYKDKQSVYKNLIKQIKKDVPNFNISKDINKKDILERTFIEIKEAFSNTNLSIWAQNSFNEYDNILEGITEMYFVNDDSNLFTEINSGVSLKKIYEDHLYKHRNRVAHNTQSYQQNLPTLKTLENENYKYENYFVWFYILVMIDKIFIELYNKYLMLLEDKIN